MEKSIMMNVSKSINMDDIALSTWVLQQYYPDSEQNVSVFKHIQMHNNFI